MSRFGSLWGRLAVLVALVGGALPAVAAGPAAHAVHLQTAWARYSFTGRGSGFLEVTGSVSGAPGAFFAVVTENAPHGPSPSTFFASVLDLDNAGGVRTYGAVGEHDLCVGPVTCTMRDGRLVFSLGFTIQGTRKHELDVRQYIVMRGAHLRIHDVVLKGWQAAHRSGGVRRLADTVASGAGARALTTSAGANLGVSAPGPAGGSIAIAVPACDVAGAGVMTLSGGRDRPVAVCPAEPITDVATGRTTWQATGAVVGASENSTRMLVIRP